MNSKSVTIVALFSLGKQNLPLTTLNLPLTEKLFTERMTFSILKSSNEGKPKSNKK